MDNQWVDWNDLHVDEALADFKKKNPDAISHIKAEANGMGEDNDHTLMSSNDHSTAPLSVISPVDMPPEVRQLFLDWRPTVPSIWTTPPESNSENTAVSMGSSPIHHDYYQPQTLIPANLSLHVAHTPYTTDHTLSDNSNHVTVTTTVCLT